MTRFLLATDLSLRSDRALRRALTLAESPDAELTILHVVDSDPGDAGHDAALHAARSRLMEQIEAVQPQAVQAENVHVVITHGRAFAEVLRVAQEQGAHLVLMGYQREEPFRTLFLGSTIDRVLRVGTTPGLIVKRASTRPYRRILVGVDFSPQSRYAVQVAMGLAANDAEIHLVHACEVVMPALAESLEGVQAAQWDAAFKAYARRELSLFLNGLPEDARLTSEVHVGPTAATLETAAGAMQADLVALGTHGKGWLQSAVLGNTAAYLVRALECDILAVRRAEADPPDA